jgi:hypothetical protein
MTDMTAAELELFARALHESAREAVERHLVVNDLGKPFLSWDEISEEAREGRRLMARALAQNKLFLISYVGL